jgi:NADH-quinone oxidoreductase subunit J
MDAKVIIEWFLGALTLISAGLVAFTPKIIHAGFSLLFTFFGVAGLYVLLGADFLAATQVLVYIGGILVLILFGVLLTHRVHHVMVVRSEPQRAFWPVVVSLGLYWLLTLVIFFTNWPTAAESVVEPTTRAIGTQLMTNYILPFEAVSVLLLGALVGALVIAREEKK